MGGAPVTRGLLSCSTCTLLFSLLDDAGRCHRCAERYAAITKQPISAAFRKPPQPRPSRRMPGRPVQLERRCHVCLMTKPRDAFPPSDKISGNMRGRCHECIEVAREERANMRALAGANVPTGGKGGGWVVPADEEGRVCRGCQQFKPWRDFYKASSSGFNGHHSRCKYCHYAPKRPKRQIDAAGRTCTRCDTYKPWADFYHLKKSPTGHMSLCAACYRRLYARI
jgi:hypothetical protein